MKARALGLAVVALSLSPHAHACPLFTAVTSKGPPTAALLGGAAGLPKNAHLFVVERWTTMAAPTTTFEVVSGATTLASDDRVLDFVGRGRLHEIVPSAALAPGEYELKWSAQAPGAVRSEDRFPFRVRDATDLAPPELVATQASAVDHPPDPKCHLWQSWRSAVMTSARDDVTSEGQLLYLVWRAGEGGLVDLDLPPTDAVSGGGATIDLGPFEDWVGVAVIDAAGHRVAPVDLPIGTPRADPRLRPLRLSVKHASTWIVDHPWQSGGALFGLLVLVSLVARRSEAKKTGSR